MKYLKFIQCRVNVLKSDNFNFIMGLLYILYIYLSKACKGGKQRILQMSVLQKGLSGDSFLKWKVNIHSFGVFPFY